MPIQRYDINSCSEDCDPVTLMKDGDYVLYAHQLADKEAALKEKDDKFNKLLSDSLIEMAGLRERIAALETQQEERRKP